MSHEVTIRNQEGQARLVFDDAHAHRGAVGAAAAPVAMI